MKWFILKRANSPADPGSGNNNKTGSQQYDGVARAWGIGLENLRSTARC